VPEALLICFIFQDIKKYTEADIRYACDQHKDDLKAFGKIPSKNNNIFESISKSLNEYLGIGSCISAHAHMKIFEQSSKNHLDFSRF
jgi:hypothetical protein